MTPEVQKKEEAAVLDVLKGTYQSWDKGDPDTFIADYLEDATAVLPGMYMKSRQEIHGSMSYSFNGPFKGTRSSGKTLNVRFLTDDVSVVVTETGILIPGETVAPPERTVYATWVLAKRDGKWNVAAYQNSPSVMPGQ